MQLRKIHNRHDSVKKVVEYFGMCQKLKKIFRRKFVGRLFKKNSDKLQDSKGKINLGNDGMVQQR